MWQLFKKLLDDEQGFVVTSELILISTIVCLAMVVGLTEVSHAVTGELIDVANGYSRLNQGRRYHKLGWHDNGGNDSMAEVSGTPARDEDH
jgi:Flp pilus assembly pilin Flp